MTRLKYPPWPLAAILAVQALLSARLLRLNTAFVDEATYLYAGHQEWNHWIHGWSVPAYATYFSGAPVIYPPLGALADSAGGLAAARLLSLLFMALATTMLWMTTRRLYGALAAFTACALFVSLGPVQHLGAFATYDPMAFALLTAGSYCAVRGAQEPDSTKLWPLAGTLLALANATKYATALWDPIVIALALLVALPEGRKALLRRSAATSAVVLALLAAALWAGGVSYYTGIGSTTVNRTAADSGAGIVFSEAWHWIGWPLALAAGALALRLLVERDWRGAAPMAVLLFAALLAPLNQARIHTTISLEKHVAFGAWFACVGAGYLFAALARFALSRSGRATLGCALAAGVLWISAPTGYAQAGTLQRSWPASTRLAGVLRPMVADPRAHYLGEDSDVILYDLRDATQRGSWNSTYFFSYEDYLTGRHLTGPAAFEAAVRDGYFKVIVLDFGATRAVDNDITAAIKANGSYRVVSVVRERAAFGGAAYTVWQYRGSGS